MVKSTALSRAGYHVRDCSLLSVFGDTDALERRALHVQMLDCDAMIVNQKRLIPIFSDVSSLELAMLPCTGNAGLGMVFTKTPIEPR
jgi:hypothetical protein